MDRLALALPLTLLVACSSSSSPSDAGMTADAGMPADAQGMDAAAQDATGAPDAGSEDAMPETDAGEGRDPACPAAAHWITSVSGTVEEGGAPSAGTKAQLCVRTSPNNILACLRPTDCGEAGDFAIGVPRNTRCVAEATMRFARPLEDYATSYCALSIGDSEAVTVVAPYQIYPTDRAVDVPPAGDGMTVGTVMFANGVELDVVPHDYLPSAGEYTDLASTEIPADLLDPCALAEEPRFDGVFGFSPEGDFTGRAAARLPNSAGLEPGSTVQVFVLGGLGCTLDDGTTVREGTWARIEDGQVSEDGAMVVVSPGLPCLTWVAYRAGN